MVRISYRAGISSPSCDPLSISGKKINTGIPNSKVFRLNWDFNLTLLIKYIIVTPHQQGQLLSIWAENETSDSLWGCLDTRKWVKVRKRNLFFLENGELCAIVSNLVKKSLDLGRVW